MNPTNEQILSLYKHANTIQTWMTSRLRPKTEDMEKLRDELRDLAVDIGKRQQRKTRLHHQILKGLDYE